MNQQVYCKGVAKQIKTIVELLNFKLENINIEEWQKEINIEIKKIESIFEYPADLFLWATKQDQFWKPLEEEVAIVFDSETLKPDFVERIASIIKVSMEQYVPDMKGVKSLYSVAMNNLSNDYRNFNSRIEILIHKIKEHRISIGSFFSIDRMLLKMLFFTAFVSVILEKFNPLEPVEGTDIPKPFLEKVFWGMGTKDIDYKFLKKDISNVANSMLGGSVEVETAGHLAMNLKGGYVRAKKVKYTCANNIENGTVIVDEVTGELAKNARSGTIFVRSSSLDLDKFPSFGNATIYIENVDTLYKDRARHDFHHIGGTLLLQNIEYWIRSTFLPSKSLWTYNDDDQEYESLGVKKKDMFGIDFKKIANKEELQNFYSQDQGLAIIESLQKLNDLDYNDMNGGILVLREVPDSNIGKGMKNGIIIIEDEKFIKEFLNNRNHAINRISKDRAGGIIAVRVPDEDNKGKTKLEIIE